MKSLTQVRWCGVALMVLLVAACFFPVLGFDFVRWDDDITVTQNPMMTEPWSWGLAADFFDPKAAMRFKPIHWFFMRGLYEVDGLNPLVFHAAGLVLHTFAAVLLFLVLAMVFRLCFPAVTSNYLELMAWLGAALWAIHPLRVEPVAWVTGSTYPLTGVFLLGSFLAYLNSQLSVKPSSAWLVGAWLGAVMAYGTYPVSVTYGLWLMVADIALFKNSPVRPFCWTDAAVRRWWLKHFLFLAPALCAVGVTVWCRLVTPGIFGAAPSLGIVTWDQRFVAALATLAIFPFKFFGLHI